MLVFYHVHSTRFFVVELWMSCHFCGDSGSYATNEIRRWGRLVAVSDPNLTWPSVQRGPFPASSLTWTETNLAAARRRVDPGRDNPGSTRDLFVMRVVTTWPRFGGAFSRQFPDVGFSAKGNPRAGGSIRSPRIKTDRVDPRSHGAFGPAISLGSGLVF
jgi:hypothetical protein